VEDFSHHVQFSHPTTRNGLRNLACPSGTGYVLHPKPPLLVLSKKEMAAHLENEHYLARVELLVKVRAECAKYLKDRAAAKGMVASDPSAMENA
jgi:hypothetical protein